jgi:hypothetical protein
VGAGAEGVGQGAMAKIHNANEKEQEQIDVLRGVAIMVV